MKVDFIKWNEFDDPNAISNNIMEQVKALGKFWVCSVLEVYVLYSRCYKLGSEAYTFGFFTGFSAEFPVSKLRHGSGDAVCLALNFLLDQTLQYQNFQVLTVFSRSNCLLFWSKYEMVYLPHAFTTIYTNTTGAVSSVCEPRVCRRSCR